MKLLLYTTKRRPWLIRIAQGLRHLLNLDKNPYSVHPDTTVLNGKIVAECDYECEHLYNTYDIYDDNVLHYFDTDTLKEKELIERSCISNLELEKYFGKSNGYAIHIKNLHIFDEPRELSDYHISYYNKELEMMREKHLEKAPQNMCRAFDVNGNYIVISIRPEWLCKILNKEKTIEVRKKVLKEMLK
jgi:predicted transcriptional regulator